MKIKKHIPNILSSLRLASPFVLIPLILSGNYLTLGILLSCFFATDALDGFLAKKWNVVSELGAKLDATADKLMLGSFLVPLLLNNPLISINLVLEALISGVNVSRMLSGGKPKTVQIGRIKMVGICIFVILSYLIKAITIPSAIYNVSFAITTLLQVFTLSKYINDAIKEKNELNKVLKEEGDNDLVENVENNLNEELQLYNSLEKVDLLEKQKEELIKMREQLLNISSCDEIVRNNGRVKKYVNNKS